MLGTASPGAIGGPAVRCEENSCFFSSRRRHTRFDCDWSSDVCSSDLVRVLLTAMDLAVESNTIREGITKTNSKQKIKDLTKRLKIIEAVRNSENKAEWMI